ncbi:MAG TPA: FAD:protein FMN transferase [Firmicutes bacterium]|nr:FAD:protein FMN transferase [Bacillota bacterium]
MKRLFSLAAGLLLLSALLAGCERRRELYTTQFVTLFDTVVTVRAYAGSRQAFDEWADDLYAELEEYHRLFDVYHEYEGMNNLCTVNRLGAAAPVEVDGRILDLLEMGKAIGEQTGGKLNIAMGAALSLWSEYRAQGMADPASAALPPAGELREAMAHADPADIQIDRGASTVFLADSLLQIDVGAVGKGYAVEQAAQRMEERAEKYDVDGALINAGGNIRTIGVRGDGTPWEVGVQDPADADRLLLKVGLSGSRALVTSGDYQRYYTVDGIRYAHIIDPGTGVPPRHMAAVSVLCGDSARADALSTALFCMTVEEGRALVESLPDTEAVWVAGDGAVTYSSGFEAHLT